MDNASHAPLDGRGPPAVILSPEDVTLAESMRAENARFMEIAGADSDDEYDDDNDGGPGEGSGGEGEEDQKASVYAFFDDAVAGAAKVYAETANYLGMTVEEATVLCRSHLVCYATKEEAMVEGGQDRLQRVVADFEKIARGSERVPASPVVAAKLLIRFALDSWVRQMSSGPDAWPLSRLQRMKKIAEARCSMKGVIDLGDLFASNSAAFVQKFHATCARLGAGWGSSASRDMALLGSIGFTNASVLCFRGLSVKNVGEEGGDVKVPLARGGGSLQGTPGTHPEVPFRPLDDVLDGAAAARGAADAAAASAAADAVGATSGEGGIVAPPSSTYGTPASTSRPPPLATDDAPIRLGSALPTGNSRLRFGKTGDGFGARLSGVHGGQQEGVFGPEQDALAKNSGVALFLRALPGVIKDHMSKHPHAAVTVQQVDGRMQDFRAYAARIEGQSELAIAVREAGLACREEVTRDRDTRHDINVLPPSAVVVGKVAEALGLARHGEREVTHESVKSVLRKHGVEDKFMPGDDDPALACSTVLKCICDTSLFCAKSFGAKIFVPGAASLSPHEVVSRRLTEMSKIDLVRREIRETPRLLKDPYRRVLVGHEEILYMQEALWASDSIRTRAGCALAALLSTSNCRIGVSTGLRTRDLHLSVVEAATEMKLADGSTQWVKNKALKLKLDIYTSKHGHVDGAARKRGSSVMSRQDRSVLVPLSFSSISSSQLPAETDVGVQLLRLLDTRGILAKDARACLEDGEFLFKHRPFRRGGQDCDCPVDDQDRGPMPSDEDWARAYGQLPIGADGCRELCPVCHRTDSIGTHMPQLIKDQNESLLIPGCQSNTTAIALFKGVAGLVGFCTKNFGGHGTRKWGAKMCYQLHGRDATVSLLGHNGEGALNLYNSAQDRQGQGGLHKTTRFVGRSVVENQEWEGDVMCTVVEAPSIVGKDLSKVKGFLGGMRYTRLRKTIMDDMAKTTVVVELERGLTEAIMAAAGDLDVVVGDERGKGRFTRRVDFTEQGWANTCDGLLARWAEAQRGDDDDEATRADVEAKVAAGTRKIIEMERLPRQMACNAEERLMRAVTKAVTAQLAADAKATRVERKSRMAEIVKLNDAASKGGGGLQERADLHLGEIATKCSEKFLQERRAAEKRRGEVLLSDLKKANSIVHTSDVDTGAPDRKEQRFTDHELKLMAQPPSLSRQFWSPNNKLPRGGRGLIHSITRGKSSAGDGSKKREVAPRMRSVGSARSPSGMSLYPTGAEMSHVAECFVTDCRAVFPLGEKVDGVMKAHLKRVHRFSNERLREVDVLFKFLCECSRCTKENKRGTLVGPKTWFKHLLRSQQLSPEARSEIQCLDRLDRFGKQLGAAVKKVRARMDDDDARRELAAVWRGATDLRSPAVSDLRLPGEDLLTPIKACYTIKLKGNGRGWVVIFPCPMSCGLYAEKGLCSETALKTEHIAKNLCQLDAAQAACYTCIVGGDACKPGRGAKFSHQSVVKHLKTHGLEELCLGAQAKTPGRLAPLSDEMLSKMDDRWLEPANANWKGSAHFEAAPGMAFTFSANVRWGPNGEIVVDPGFCVGPPTLGRDVTSGGGGATSGSADAGAGAGTADERPRQIEKQQAVMVDRRRSGLSGTRGRKPEKVVNGPSSKRGLSMRSLNAPRAPSGEGDAARGGVGGGHVVVSLSGRIKAEATPPPATGTGAEAIVDLTSPDAHVVNTGSKRRDGSASETGYTPSKKKPA